MEIVLNSKKNPQAAYYTKINDTLGQVIKKIPREYFQKNMAQVASSMAKTFGFLFLAGATIAVLPKFLGWYLAVPVAAVVSWFLLGTALTGAFDLAHDAAHRSLFKTARWNNFWGHILSSITGWPFHLWRVAHDIHHRYTNNAEKDIAWEPYTQERLALLPKTYRFLYKKIRTSAGFLSLAGFLHLLEQIVRFSKNSRRFRKNRSEIMFSFGITILIFGGAVGLLSYHFGLYGLVFLVLIPLARYYYWLSTFTLLHHTHPDQPFLPDSVWKDHSGAAQLLGTINVRYGWYVDFLTHDIAWHVPHHVSVGIPHYHLKAATQHLMRIYPGLLRDVEFSRSYLQSVLDSCHYVNSLNDPQWKKFGEPQAEMSLDAESLPVKA